jgi:hypothetical protein
LCPSLNTVCFSTCLNPLQRIFLTWVFFSILLHEVSSYRVCITCKCICHSSTKSISVKEERCEGSTIVKWCFINFVGFVWREIFGIWLWVFFNQGLGRHLKKACDTYSCKKCEDNSMLWQMGQDEEEIFSKKDSKRCSIGWNKFWRAQQRQMAHLMDLIKVMLMLDLPSTKHWKRFTKWWYKSKSS